MIPSSAPKEYRPEIDGLRAIAVLAVLINHLNPSWLPGGYLGVDLFFVISGYVVTGSLIGRQHNGAKSFLLDFYRRRLRRLMPALTVNILIVAILFAALVNPGDGVIKPTLRSGITALFGLSNLYFLRQGNDYFAADNHYNPFLHTWSLGVEEQFYLLWPFVLLVCGVGRLSSDRSRLRLTRWTLGLSAASLVLLFWFQGRGDQAAMFYLMPCRFWELATGTMVLLWRTATGFTLPGSVSSSRWSGMLLAGLGAVFLMPETWRVPATITSVAISAALLLLLRERQGPGRWLSRSWPLAIGLGSYSLYLWHWPVLVLARWSVGINRTTLIPILMMIGLLTWLSFQLESRFRRPRDQRRQARPLLLYPLLSVAVGGVVAMLQGPALGLLFIGDRNRIGIDMANSRFVPGTAINTVNCSRNPLDPVSTAADDTRCQLRRFPGRPTLFFEGDSHTEVLIPLGTGLLQAHYNLSFFSRGGCPSPPFSPRAGLSHRNPLYRLCEPDDQARLQRRLQQIRPGDVLVLSSNLPGYLFENDDKPLLPALVDHRRRLRQLASQLRQRGADLIVIGPLPHFPGRPRLSAPVSLCLKEWYRQSVENLPGCKPTMVVRRDQLRRLAPLERHLQSLEGEISNLHVFRPFAILCPMKHSQCSTHLGSRMLFADSNHLSREGVRQLEAPFLDAVDTVITGHRSRVFPPGPPARRPPPDPPVHRG